MKKFDVMIVGCMAIIVSGCNVTFLVNGEPGSGITVTEDREVGDFAELALSGSGKINVVCGQAPSLTLTTDDNLLELIETNVSGDSLKISTVKNIRPTIGPEYDITTQRLERLGISGSGQIDIQDFDGDTLDFDISGSGKISVVGRADSVTLDIAGSGNADLSRLVANDASISISGSGRVKVNASQNLKIAIAGSGRIEYVGDPKISKSISGSGKIQRMTVLSIGTDSGEVSADIDEPNSEEDELSDDDEESE